MPTLHGPAFDTCLALVVTMRLQERILTHSLAEKMRICKARYQIQLQRNTVQCRKCTDVKMTHNQSMS